MADFIVEMRKHIEEDESITEAKLVVAREAAEYARSIAPVDEGDYRDGIQAQNIGASGVGVVFTDWKSVIIEYGAEGNKPEFAVASRTSEHFRNQ
ncbi:hypothetical protein [Mycolicibacterium canariasense]|uniref:hypothetical protein n=1 Tax=Mycolicibacterium canariasense TaxID=228230 RepID=UPI0032D56861